MNEDKYSFKFHESNYSRKLFISLDHVVLTK